MKKCSECGALIDSSSKFCTECGAVLSDDEAVEETVDTPAEEIVDEVIDAPAEEVVEETTPVVPVVTPEFEEHAAPEAPVQEIKEDLPKKGEHTVKGRAFGIIGFIIGLEALLSCLVPGSNYIALIYSIICLIFCRISKNNTRFRLTKVARVFGILALIFSIVTIVLYGVLIYIAIRALADSSIVEDFMGQLSTFMNQFN